MLTTQAQETLMMNENDSWITGCETRTVFVEGEQKDMNHAAMQDVSGITCRTNDSHHLLRCCTI